MKRCVFAGWFGLFLWTVGAWPCAAEDTVYRETEGRKAWFTFLKPACETPAKQLDYARKLRAKGSWRAVRQYRALVASWPTSPEALLAQMEKAKTLDDRGHWAAAFEAYTETLDQYSSLVPYDQIVERQYVIAKQVLQQRSARWLFGGFPAPEQAIPLLEGIVKRAPRASFAAEAQYQIAQAYASNEDFEMAVSSYGLVLSLYPDSEWAQESTFQRAFLLFELSKRSPNDRQLSEDTWYALSFAMHKYPKNNHVKLAENYLATTQTRRIFQAYRIALYYDRSGTKPGAALVMYRLFVKRFPDAPQIEGVQARIEVLTQQIAEKAGAL